ncbi:MAG TPA: transporter [Myxococcaceae bacterium]
MTFRRSVLPGILLLASSLVPAEALACATCGCGDPTLTTMGSEQPFAGRFRMGVQATAGTLVIGTKGVDLEQVAEARFDLSAAYAPLPWLFFSASMPLLARQVTDVNLARELGVGPGDLDLRARAYVFKDRDFGAHHLLAVSLGVALPTGPALHDEAAVPLSLDAQVGTGAVTPIAGLAYSGFFGDVSAYASVTGALPGRGYQGFRRGLQVRSTLAGQFQLNTRWALRMAVDTQWEAPGEDADGTPDLVGAGLMAYASPDVIFSPTQDVVLQLGIRWHFLALTPQPFHPGPLLAFAVAYDR